MGGPWCYAGARPAVHAMPCQQCWLHNPKHDARAEKPLKKKLGNTPCHVSGLIPAVH
jgi:hypothetical protein